jgi:plastocyanin
MNGVLVMRRTYWAKLFLVGVLAACGSSTSPSDGGGGGGVGGGGGSNATITVGNDFFNPTPNTVAAGAVTFTWATPSSGHTLVWDSGPGTLPANIGFLTSGSRTVTLQPGVYEYHCSIHGARGSGMHGTITAQ